MFTGAVPVVVEHTPWSPASTAGLAVVQPLGVPLPVHSANVCVGPPLAARPAGSSSGLRLQYDVPEVDEQPDPVKPHVAPSSRL